MDDTNLNTETVTVNLAELQQIVQSAVSQAGNAQVQAQQGTSLLLVDRQMELEESRRNQERLMEIRRTKLEMIRVATGTLESNAKSKPVDERDITALDITKFADELIQYINEE
jgi:hypothetical protein